MSQLCLHSYLIYFLVKKDYICAYINSLIFNPPPQSGEGILGMHFVSLSVRPSVTFRVRSITYVCIDGLPGLVESMTLFVPCNTFLENIVILITVKNIKVILWASEPICSIVRYCFRSFKQL